MLWFLKTTWVSWKAIKKNAVKSTDNTSKLILKSSYVTNALLVLKLFWTRDVICFWSSLRKFYSFSYIVLPSPCRKENLAAISTAPRRVVFKLHREVNCGLGVLAQPALTCSKSKMETPAKAISEICSKLTVKTTDRRQWHATQIDENGGREIYFFIYLSSLSRILTVYRTVKEGKGTIFVPPHHVHSLTNIEIFAFMHLRCLTPSFSRWCFNRAASSKSDLQSIWSWNFLEPEILSNTQTPADFPFGIFSQFPE